MAGTHNFTIVENDTWDFHVTWTEADGTTPIDLTGYTGKVQLRAAFDGPLLLTANATIPTPTNGVLQFSLAATVTQGTYVYDVEVNATGYKKTIVRGTVTVLPEVCQDAG